MMPQLVLVSFVLLGMGAAVAQSYPVKPIRLIVPFPPGGTADVVARPVAQRLSEVLGQGVVVDNRPGATGTIGAALVAKATPDGHVLLLGTTNELCMSPGLYGKLPYDPTKDFSPITNIISFPNILVVHPSTPVRSLTELIALARAAPRELSFSSSGAGSTNHLSAELLKSIAKIDINHVPYKGGGPAMGAVMGGEVQAMFAGMPPAVSLIKGGKLKAIFVTSHKRSPALPDVPNAIEAGAPDLVVSTWNGILAPAGTPREVIVKLHAELVKIANAPEMKERMAAQAAEIMTTTPEEFAAMIREDFQKWYRIVKASGARAD